MAQNSQIRAKGVGKNSKRHDLDGTPGLSAGSSLQYGETKQLEAGQKALKNAGAGAAPATSGAAPAAGPMEVPDGVDFAIDRLGGGRPAVPTQEITNYDTSEFLPMLRKLAEGNSSSLLKEAYMKMVANIAKKPWAAQTAVIDMQELDRNVEQAF